MKTSPVLSAVFAFGLASLWAQRPIPVAASKLPAPAANQPLTREECSSAKLGAAIPVASIGEPVAGVALSAPVWNEAKGNLPAYCSVDGSMAPLDQSPHGRPIGFRVLLPASWNHRAAQLGGGGMNGTIPLLTGLSGTFGQGIASPLERGFATYGSDSGHQSAPPGPGRGARAPEPPGASDWVLSEEAIRNLGYLQMKKTHDAAMVLIERAYGGKPRFNYYLGGSQGGREGLTVAQRYPADYDGIVANVPIVAFSSLMLAPELVLIHQKPLANWVTPAKMNAIRAELMRQCDKLDGLADGVINNYMACRAIFDLTGGAPDRHPWAARRCPDNVDPNPADTGSGACLTAGQISSLEFVFSRYRFATPLANGLQTFGMWAPTTEPSGTALVSPVRYRGQEGAGENAPMHTALGILGVTGFLMGNVAANPLDYVEGGKWNARREQLSAWLDATNPDLTPFYRRGGKLIVTIGTNDSVAASGAQLDYYQSVIDKMGRPAVDAFARFYVLAQGGHGLTGSSHTVDGDGKTVAPFPLSAKFDRIAAIQDWVERNTPPAKVLTVPAGDRTMPLCSYPAYPKYSGGAPEKAESYTCAEK